MGKLEAVAEISIVIFSSPRTLHLKIQDYRSVAPGVPFPFPFPYKMELERDDMQITPTSKA